MPRLRQATHVVLIDRPTPFAEIRLVNGPRCLPMRRMAVRVAGTGSDVPAINAVSVINAQLEQARTELEQAQRRGDLSLSAELQYGKIPELEKTLADVQSRAGEAVAPTGAGSHPGLLRQEVTEEDIATKLRLKGSADRIQITAK